MGASVQGGVALFRSAARFHDRELSMAERLAEVLSLTLETFQTEQVLLRLFATALPDLCADDAPTTFRARLSEYLHALRMSPDYRRQLALAEAVGKVAALGPAETQLTAEVLTSFERYLSGLADQPGDDPLSTSDMLLDDDLFS